MSRFCIKLHWAAFVLVPCILLLTAVPLFAGAASGKITFEDRAWINAIEKYRPDIAEDLKRRLERAEARIKRQELDGEQAQKLREAAFERTLQDAERARKAAGQFGNEEQQDNAKRVTDLIRMFTPFYMYTGYFEHHYSLRGVDQNVAWSEWFSAIDRLTRAAEEKRRQAEQEGGDEQSSLPRTGLQDGHSMAPGGFEPYVGFRAGQVDLPDVSFLRTELGGMIDDPDFGERKRSVSFNGFDAAFHMPIMGRQIGGKQVSISAFGAISTGNAEVDQGFSLDAGGNELGILGVEGEEDGALGGGLVTGPGFGDVTDGVYWASYDEWSVRGGGEGRFNLFRSPLEVGVRLAFLYGETDEESLFRGVTNEGTVNFQYDTRLETERVGGELGVNLRYPLFSPEIGIYGDAAGRFTSDDASGRIDLMADFDGSPFPSETQEMNDSQFNVGGRFGGGLYVDIGTFHGFAGVEYETSNIPTVEVTGTDPAEIDFERRDSMAAKVGFSFGF